MIVVKVELHSAITHQMTELARMHIANVGGTERLGDVRTLRGRSAEAFARPVTQRAGKVTGHARLSLHVWFLVAKALAAMGYARAPEPAPVLPLHPLDTRDGGRFG